jgi:hypothetical protein
MAIWRIILTLSATLLPTSGVVGGDASGFDRSHDSRHYTERAELTIQQLNVMLLVDMKVNAIPRISTFYVLTKATTTRKSDDLPSNTRFVH